VTRSKEETVYSRRFRAAAALCLALVLVAGCGKKEEKEAGAGTTLMTVDGAEITTVDVENEVGRLSRHLAASYPPEQLQEMRAQVEEQARENLVHKILLEKAAEKEGIAISEDEVSTRLASYKSGFPSEEAYAEELQGMGLSEEEFREEVKGEWRIEKLLASRTENLPLPSEEEIALFYDSNRNLFQRGESIRASHILVMFQDGDTDAIKAAKRDSIESIHGQVVGGSDFADLARRCSGCPSAKNGGDLGWFERGRMVEAFEQAAFALGNGEVSPVVETQFGYHVIKATERRPASEAPLAEVHDAIVRELGRNAQRNVIQAYLQSLREQADIRILSGPDAG